jgi:hypothetical protein
MFKNNKCFKSNAYVLWKWIEAVSNSCNPRCFGGRDKAGPSINLRLYLKNNYIQRWCGSSGRATA